MGYVACKKKNRITGVPAILFFTIQAFRSFNFLDSLDFS
jgi:hypothetical protein